MTVKMITHYMDEAVHTDRRIVMESGKILLDGSPADVFKQKGHHKKNRPNAAGGL